MEKFSDQTSFEQILFLDNFYSNVDLKSCNRAILANQLNQAYLTTDNQYIKRLLLIIISDLTLSKVFSDPYLALVLISSALDRDEIVLLPTCIKYYSLLIQDYTLDYKDRIEKYMDDDNGEIASEAALWLGFSSMFNILCAENSIGDIIPGLNASKDSFEYAIESTENRDDAVYLIGVLDFILSIVNNDRDGIKDAYKDANDALLTLFMYELDASIVDLYLLIYVKLTDLQSLFLNLGNSAAWYDFSADLQEIMAINQSLLITHQSLGKPEWIKGEILRKTVSRLSDILIAQNLQNEAPRIYRLHEDTGDETFAGFLDYLLKKLSRTEILHNENNLFLSVCVDLLGIQEGMETYQNTINKQDINEVTKVFASLKTKLKIVNKGFLTGSPVGQEVFLTLKEDLKEKLPDYPVEKFGLFLGILANVITYTKKTISNSSKSEFPFLYTKRDGGFGQEASEENVQDSLYHYLGLTDLAYAYEYEKSRFVDGGRVDIVFSTDEITIPIEVKKTLVRPTKKGMEELYLAQAQTYTSVYDRLGIFMIMDIADHHNLPSPDFRDLFSIHHIPPSSSISTNHPDYLVAVVVPGNKALPSSRSIYK
jgi:hypothetical protein